MYYERGISWYMDQNLQRKLPLNIGLVAHVDAGKTTLSEALLYCNGTRRVLGRVDHRDAYLDTYDLERARGITIFSKQARMETEHFALTLVDTPGHMDFSAEAERTLPILDCAVLVISGTDGIQAHTVTLWRLLQRYQVPTFLFINKMDLPGADRETVLSQLRREFGEGCLDFGADFGEIAEGAAMCDEALLENYLETGTVTQANLRGLIESRKVFPCCFGSALKLTGVAEFLQVLDTYAPRKTYARDFAARVYKISRDPQGNRLTWLKVTGGSLKVRGTLAYQDRQGESYEEKAAQLRLYSGDKFSTPEQVDAGMLAAVTGLTQTYAGQALGAEPGGLDPVLEPVMTYRVGLPKGSDPAVVMPKLKLLEEEDPELHLLWERGEIHVQIMGQVQLEIFRSLVSQRFGLDITLEDRRIVYMETIEAPVEGIGHFEPLRHYAECHLLLEPLPRGSGIYYDTVCPTDILDINYQRTVIAQLEQKIHRGVLVGAPITDMRITLLVGKAHVKHTEGGDFRQAAYRAVRQGLMKAKSILLEPWYDFVLTVPGEQIGRAITDIRMMGGEITPPESVEGTAVLKGTVPASEVGDYAQQVASYTQGTGRLQLSLRGYAPCHNQEEVVAQLAYDPEGDLDNPPDSVFCAHGSGFTVKWNEVEDYMHLESGYGEKKEPQIITYHMESDERELEKIMEREFGPMKTKLYRPPVNRAATEQVVIRPLKERCIIVDGYNIIFAWEELARQARADLDAARRALCDSLSSFAGFTKQRIILVFDGYQQPGNPGEKSRFHNIQVVYTKEGETADQYIESLAAEIGNNYAVRVATSDGLVQLSSFRSGVLRMSARELRDEVDRANQEMRQHFHK